MKKFKIIIFSEDFPPYHGGIAQWAYGMAVALTNKNQDVHVLTRFRSSFSDNNYQLTPFDVRFIHGKHWKKLRTLYCYNAIKKVINSFKPDIIIATTWNFARGITKITRNNNILLITLLHGLEITRRLNFIKKYWLQTTLQKSDLVLAVSNFTREQVIHKYRLDENQVKVLHNGVSLENLHHHNTGKTCETEQENQKDNIILTLARVIPRKGHDDVIRSLPDITRRFKKVKYIIAGSEDLEYKTYLLKLVKEMKLENHVIFYGSVNGKEKDKLYHDADVYIMPGKKLDHKGDSEGFGITFLEANAFSKPVIGGRTGGVPDAIDDGKSGFLIEPGNIQQITEKLIYLLGSPDVARKMGEYGKKRIENRFTWNHIADHFLNIVNNHRE